MSGAPLKPASKFPQLRKQMQKNRIAQGANQLKTLRLKSTRKNKSPEGRP